jgi:hypothetical protein
MRPKSYGMSKYLRNKSLLETCAYKLVRIRHATGEPNPSSLPTHDSPVFDYLFLHSCNT